MDLSKRSVGVNFKVNQEAEVCLWAPLAKKVELVLNKGDKKIPLEKKDYGYWQTITKEVKPGTLYKFSLEGQYYPDPASLAQPEGVHGPSQAIDLRKFTWNDKEWINTPLEEYLIYELHTGTFSPEGTFAGIEEQLDHLKELGINAIEIMPVAQFPGSRNWGYDGVFPFAVQHSYGGAEGLMHLVNTCHKKGIAVILDLVYNHMGPEGNYFNAFGPYFTEKYNTPWGNAINFDDAWCDQVRQYFIENALMWFRDFHVDALRLDAVHAIKDFSPVHILREIKEQANLLMKETGRQFYLIVELDLNDNRFINPLENSGYGMDAQWIDEFHHALRVTAGGERNGYYEDFAGIAHLAKAYRDAYVYNGIYSEHRSRTFGTRADENPGKQFVVFSQNHDQVGNRMLGERSSQLFSYEMQKLLAVAVMVSPYLPMLFMGEEWAESNPFLYFVSHGDPELIEAVRNGRKAEFAAFHAEGEAPDPQAEETFGQSKLQWNLLGSGKHQTMFAFYKDLIAVRKQYPALYLLNRDNLAVEYDEQKQTLLLKRWHKDQQIICLMNFSKSSQQTGIDGSGSTLKRILDSADPKWSGPASAPDLIHTNTTINIQPESALIYTNSYV